MVGGASPCPLGKLGRHDVDVRGQQEFPWVLPRLLTLAPVAEGLPVSGLQIGV